MAGSTAELLVLITAKDAASSAIKGLGNSLGGLGGAGKVATAALAGIATVGAGLVAGIGHAVGVATDFEHAMSAVGAVSGASSSELAQLSQTALALGQDVTLAGISASDAASAMAELASGGVSVADIMGGAARGALLLASAGGIDVAQAADIAAAALNNFGLAGTQTGHVADLFAAAANSSAVTVTDLGESLKYIGPIANSMGLSIEDVTAALAELGDQGIKSSQAGTSLRGIIASIAKPSQQAADVIKDLGLQFFDASGKMKDLGGISGELHDKLAGLTDQQRANALVTLFGNEALSAATVLYGEGADGLKKYLDQVNVAGSAAANGAKRNDNLRGSIEQLKSAVETAEITLGTAFIPLLRTLTDQAARAVTAAIPLIAVYGPKFAAAIQAGLGRATTVVSAFAAAIVALFRSLATGDFSALFGPLIGAISTAFGSDTAGKVTLFVSKLVTNLNLARDAVITARQAFAGDWIDADTFIAKPVRIVGEAFTTLGDWVRTAQGYLAQIPQPVLAAAAAFIALGPAIRIALAVLPALVGAFTGLGPIISLVTSTIPVIGAVIAALGGPLTIAIAAVAALGVAWATNFLGIRDSTMPVVAEIVAFFNGTLLPALTNLGTFVGTTVVPAFVAGWAAIQAAVSAAIAIILPIVQQFSDWFTTNLLPALQGFIAVAIPAFQQMATAAQGAFQAALPGIQAFIAGVQQLAAVVLPILAQVGQVILNQLGPAIMAMVGWATTALPQFAAAFTSVMAVVGPVVGALASLIGGALSLIAGFVGAHSAQITTILIGAWNIISATIGAVFAVITGIISAGLQLISGDFDGAWKTIQNTATSVWGSIQTIITSAIAVVGTAVVIGVSTWGAVLSTAWASIQSLAASAWAAVVSAVTTAMGQLGAAIGTGVTTAITLIAGLPGRAAAAVGNLANTLFSAGANLVQGFINGINSKIQEAIGLAGQLGNLISGGVRAVLGEHSPSTVFAEIGDYAVQGLINGMALRSADAAGAAHQLGALTIGGLTTAVDEKTADLQKKLADTVSAVAKAVQDTLAALKALSSFDVAKNTPSAGQIGGVTAFIANMTAIIAEVAAQFSEKALKAASDFSDAAGKVTSLVASGVAALTALGKFVAPADAAIYAFGKSLRAIVNDFAVLSEQITKEMYTEAADFADSAGKVVAIIGTGVTGFTALTTFVGPPVAAIYAFGKTLRAVVNDFAVLAEQVTADMYTEAASFAEGAGKVVGIIGTGVAAFLALGTYTDPGVAAIYAFGKTIRAVINDFALLAEQITQDATDQAAKFAEGAGKVVAIIGGAVDGLSKLADFVAPSQEAIDNFVYAVYETVRKIGEMAAQMSGDGITLAGAFGVAAGSVFAALKTALDVFTGLAKLVVPSAQAIDNFGVAVAYTVRRIGDFADQIGKEGIKRAGDFGQSVGTIFGALKSAIDILTGLEKFPDLAKKAMDAFFKGVQAVVARMAEATDQAGEFAKQAAGYKAQILAGVADVKAAQQALNTIGGIGGTPDLKNIGQGLANSVIAGVTDTLETHSPSQVMVQVGKDVVAGLVEGMDSAQQDALSKAAQVAGNVADAVSKALDAFAKLSGFSAPPVSAIYAFGKTLKAAVNDLALIAEQVTTEASDLAGKFGEGASKAIGVFAGGIDGFLKLKDYVAPAPAAIYAFGKTLRLAIADLAIVAEQVTTDSSDLAGKFADGAGKAIAVIGGGVESFLKLVDYVAPAPAAVESFLAGVKQVVSRLADAATLIGDKPLAQALAFGDAAGSIFRALKDGLDLLITIDKPGNWPLTDWLQPLIELMSGVLSRGGVLLTQAQQLRDIAQGFADGITASMALFQAGGALLAGGLTLPTTGAAWSSGAGAGAGSVTNIYVTGNTLLSKDTSTQQMVSSIVTTQQGRTIGYSAG